MTWAELEKWAEKKKFSAPQAVHVCGQWKAFFHVPRQVFIEAHNCASRSAGKRALCRAVSRILESER